mmetsp:Transcript_80755/g.140186  ORF Transcript_80755/g.140186 Transcript_80755/m.140186 type:complete len:388 (+) Transcript_80755:47-1210(+)
MADIDEDGEKKEGPELFKELFRLLPSVEVEDYYKGGRWQDVDIQLDIDLLSAHRKEAGAPEPPAVEDLEIPKLPANGGYGGITRLGIGGAGAYGAGAYPAGARPLISGIKPAMPKITTIAKPALTSSTLKPSPPKAAPSAATVAAATSAGGPSAELRQIALFIAKWKLEATKTKLLLARLTPTRRRYVMAKFTATGGTATTPQLEQYIGQCERTNSWANADTADLSGPSLSSSGLKRPLGAGASVSDPKKQKIVPTTTSSRPSTPTLMSRPPAQTSVGRIGAKPGAYGGIGKPAAPKPFGAKPFGAKPPAVTRSAYAPVKPTTPKISSAAPRPAVSSGYKPATAKPPGAKISSGIKPSAPKAGAKIGGAPKAGGAKPGSLIKNLLNL